MVSGTLDGRAFRTRRGAGDRRTVPGNPFTLPTEQNGKRKGPRDNRPGSPLCRLDSLRESLPVIAVKQKRRGHRLGGR